MLSYIKSFFVDPPGQIADMSRNMVLPAAEDISGSIEFDAGSRPVPCMMTGLVLPPWGMVNPHFDVKLRENGVQQEANLTEEQVAALVQNLDNQIRYCGKVVELPNLDSFTNNQSG